MRFTVHDSPDYYQLKVSLFNDDKKTELIGETWVALDQIIIPGGGKNDFWHNLTCKGRYAGDLRMELTYYDIRPREDKPEDRRQSAPINGAIEPAGNHVGGPRQPRPVKRRPLPADPTGSSHSSPLPQTPPSNVPQLPNSQQRYVESPDDYGYISSPLPPRQDTRLRDVQPRASLLNSNIQYQESFNGSEDTGRSSHGPGSIHFDAHSLAGEQEYRHEDALVLSQGPENAQVHDRLHDYIPGYVLDHHPRPLAQPLQQSYGEPHANSSPAIIDARPRRHTPDNQQDTHSIPQPRGHSFDMSPKSQYPRDDGFGTWPSNGSVTGDQYEAPPPPPTHKNSGSRPSPQLEIRAQPEPYNYVPITAPLNVRNGRSSIPGSPLSQIQSNSIYHDHPLTSPSHSKSYQSYSNPTASMSSQTPYYLDLQTQSPLRDYGRTMPPSFKPGYEPSIADEESERIIHERRMSRKPRCSEPSIPQYQPMPMPVDQSRPQPALRNLQDAHGRRAHRASAPMMPHSVQADPRTPVRKSVSPQPDSAPTERPRSEVPFSPDSFDAFNPSLNAARSVNDLGARYNSPQQAVEASRQHERQEQLGNGPIIGADGRIIDPSDHLPTDTWAPEPEQKPVKKGPEVTIRFRHSPRGAQPPPHAVRPPLNEIRSSPAAAPMHPVSSETLGSGGRARLQKRSPAGVAHPASSPQLPTLNTTARSSPLRPSGYPLRECENYGGHNSSPSYGRNNIPPPVPGKVPIGMPQENWGMDALSEEMARIDIGVGGRQREPRKHRFGF